MPSSRTRKRQAPERVELAPGVTIPDHFVATFPSGPGSWSVEIRTDPTSRIPRWIRRAEHAGEEGEPITEVSDELWRRRMEHAIAQQAARLAADRMMREAGAKWAVGPAFFEHYPEVTPEDLPFEAGGMMLDQAELDRIGDSAAEVVRPRSGRRPVTDEEKLRILELYRTKGIAETMAITGKKERTIRRYIADARRIEQGEH
jgi:hypothetical protein